MENKITLILSEDEFNTLFTAFCLAENETHTTLNLMSSQELKDKYSMQLGKLSHLSLVLLGQKKKQDYELKKLGFQIEADRLNDVKKETEVEHEFEPKHIMGIMKSRG